MKFRQAFICLSIVFVFLIAGCEKPAQAPMKMSDVKVAVVTSKAWSRGRGSSPSPRIPPP